MNFTLEQAAAIETEGPFLCVDASAGSGKTRVLVERIQRLLSEGRAGLDNLVAMTFTDNAAAEMRQRLRDAFRDAGNSAKFADEMTKWRDLERRVETARISTFHGFCMGLLKQHALRRGLDPDFAVLTEAEAYLQREEVIETTLHDALGTDDEAAMRVTSEHGVSNVVKALRTLLRQRHTIDRLQDRSMLRVPEALLDMWRRQIQEEQTRRLEEFLGLPELRDCHKRLHALDGACSDESDLRERMRVEMLDIVDAVLHAGDAATIRGHMETLRALKATGRNKKNWIPEDSFDEVKAIRDALKLLIDEALLAAFDEDRETRAAQLTCDFYAIYERVAVALRTAKADRNGYDFDDLILEALHLLREDDEVRRQVAQGCTFLLIDEFQDTDSRQLEIANMLAAQPNGPAVFIVGDAKQSIYLFRGAEVEVFAKAREKAGPEHVLPLRTNFRSVPDILAFVNEFFAVSGLLSAVEPVYKPLDAHRKATGEPRVALLLPEKVDGAKRTAYRPHEADLIARRIAEMCSGPNGVKVFDGHQSEERPARFGDVALLFRSLSHVHIYERALKEREIPYTLVAGKGFYARQEVIDLRNLLSLVIDPWDEMALLGFLRSPMVGLSDNAILRLNANGGLACAFHGKVTPEDPVEKVLLEEARCLFKTLRDRRELPLQAFLRYVLDETRCEAVALSQFLGPQKASNVRKVASLAHDFARSRPPKLSVFVRYLDEVAAEEIRESEAALQPEGSNAVTLTTIHQAKGMEYAIVFVPDVSRDARQPSREIVNVHPELGMAVTVSGAKGETVKPVLFEVIQDDRWKRELAEHARLLYVAMTRARDWLVLSGAPELKRASKSWLQAFHKCYGVLDKADGETLAGEGWQAVVRRKVADHRATVDKAGREQPPPREVLERRIQRVPATQAGQKIFRVTDLAKIMAGEPDDAGSKSSAPPVDAMLWGALVHQLLERWDLVSPIEPVIDTLLKRECPAPGARRELAEALKAVGARVQVSDLGKQLARVPIAQREVPFLLRIDNALVSGKIDAMLEDGAIIDYKTGHYRPDLHACHEWQVRLYAAAVRQLLGKEPPDAYVYYVEGAAESDSRHSVDISPALIEETLSLATSAVRTLRERPIGPATTES